METLSNIKEVSLPQPKSTDKGKRWKWHKNVPDEAYWPQCRFCSAFLKIKPVGFMKRFSKYEPYSYIIAIRVCTHCKEEDHRKYFGETDDLS